MEERLELLAGCLISASHGEKMVPFCFHIFNGKFLPTRTHHSFLIDQEAKPRDQSIEVAVLYAAGHMAPKMAAVMTAYRTDSMTCPTMRQ
jgi:hypothetical protein